MTLSYAFLDVGIGEQLKWTAAFILILGIPHGAIDHVLLLEKKEMSKTLFYSIYLGLIILNLVMWFLFPLISLLFFLVLSAYHFGQSQFAFVKKSLFSKSLYFTWGISILSALLYYNHGEIASLSAYTAEFEVYTGDQYLSFLKILMLGSTALSIALMIFLTWKQSIQLERMAIEFILLGLIHFSFNLLPLLVGFALYFVVLHSLKVMLDEYDYFQSSRKSFSPAKFLALLTPFSLISFAGCIILFVLWSYGFIQVSATFLLLAFLSAITIPHSIVMEVFYGE